MKSSIVSLIAAVLFEEIEEHEHFDGALCVNSTKTTKCGNKRRPGHCLCDPCRISAGGYPHEKVRTDRRTGHVVVSQEALPSA